MTDQDQMRERATPPDQDARRPVWLDVVDARSTTIGDMRDLISYARRLEQERNYWKVDRDIAFQANASLEKRVKAAEQERDEQRELKLAAVDLKRIAERRVRELEAEIELDKNLLAERGRALDARAPLEGELAQARARLTAAAKALVTYGDHVDKRCAAIYSDRNRCTCGYAAAVAAANGAPSTTTEIADALVRALRETHDNIAPGVWVPKTKPPFERLIELLAEAGMRPCFCLDCKHQESHGPCAKCGCSNAPRPKSTNNPSGEEAG